MTPTLLRYEFGRDPCSESCSKRQATQKFLHIRRQVVLWHTEEKSSVHTDFGVPNEILKYRPYNEEVKITIVGFTRKTDYKE